MYSTCAILKMLQNTVLISKRTDAALFHQVQSFSRTFIVVAKNRRQKNIFTTGLAKIHLNKKCMQSER